jgi:tripartite-type tricarboxylate transporter receptor subunit TctC
MAFQKRRKIVRGRARTMNTRTMRIWRLRAAMAVWLMSLALSGAGWAQENFPNRPVRVLIPYSAGSVVDVFGRIVTQNMAAQWNG